MSQPCDVRWLECWLDCLPASGAREDLVARLKAAKTFKQRTDLILELAD